MPLAVAEGGGRKIQAAATFAVMTRSRRRLGDQPPRYQLGPPCRQCPTSLRGPSLLKSSRVVS